MVALREFLKAAESTPAIAPWFGLIFVISILCITRKSKVGKRSFANEQQFPQVLF